MIAFRRTDTGLLDSGSALGSAKDFYFYHSGLAIRAQRVIENETYSKVRAVAVPPLLFMLSVYVLFFWY